MIMDCFSFFCYDYDRNQELLYNEQLDKLSIQLDVIIEFIESYENKHNLKSFNMEPPTLTPPTRDPPLSGHNNSPSSPPPPPPAPPAPNEMLSAITAEISRRNTTS